MNKRYSLKIPLRLKESREETSEGKELKFNVNVLLNPFYISESSLISIFVGEEDFEQYFQMLYLKLVPTEPTCFQ